MSHRQRCRPRTPRAFAAPLMLAVRGSGLSRRLHIRRYCRRVALTVSDAQANVADQPAEVVPLLFSNLGQRRSDPATNVA